MGRCGGCAERGTKQGNARVVLLEWGVRGGGGVGCSVVVGVVESFVRVV